MNHSQAYELLHAAGVRYHELLQFADECRDLEEWYDAVIEDDLVVVLVRVGVDFWRVVNVVLQVTEGPLLCRLCEIAQYKTPWAAGDLFCSFARSTGLDVGPLLRAEFPFDAVLEAILLAAT